MQMSINLLLVLLLAANPSSSRLAPVEQQRFFVEPSETVTTVIAYQPSSGIEFTKALVVHGVDSGVGHVYQVRNRGPKTIRSYQVAALTSAGTGSEWSFKSTESEGLLHPGETRPSSIESFGIRIVPLTKELREKHKLYGPSLGIVVFMVVRVLFDDGTEYDGSGEYNALKDFFDKHPVIPAR